MSLVAERPTTRRRPSAKRSTRVAQSTGTRARVRTRPTRRPRTGTLVNSLIAVACLALFTFVTSSVVGNTMLEKARRDRIRAVERTKDSREEVSRLRRVLNGMTSMESVDRYAMANGLVLSGVEVPDAARTPSTPSAESRTIVAAASASPEAELSILARPVVAMASEHLSEEQNGAHPR